MNRVCNKLEGLEVLCLGFAGDYERYIKDPSDWIFDHLHKISKVTGIDYNEQAVNAFKEKYDVKCADITKYYQEVDAIVAHDVIEHVPSLDKFFDTCYANLRENGLLIITTPNPYSINLMLHGLLGNVNNKILSEHVCMFTAPNIRELARRHGFIVSYSDSLSGGTGKKDHLIRVIGKLFPHFNQSLYFELKKGDEK